MLCRLYTMLKHYSFFALPPFKLNGNDATGPWYVVNE